MGLGVALGWVDDCLDMIGIEFKRWLWRSFIANVFLCLCTIGEATAEPSTPPVPNPVVIEADVGKLPASEQAALVYIIRAARQMDALYMRQRTAIIAGVPSERPIGDFYPSGATKHDIDAWLATRSGEERRRALDSFTTIERGRDGSFAVIPYNRHYEDNLAEASKALNEAAAITHEETLKKYLSLRAKALLNDDYYASDVAFVGLKGPIDVVLGPYEVDDDSWFGVKTAYEAAIALVNASATERTSKISLHLQELEDHLPLTPDLRGRHLGAAAPIVVLDVIYQGGFAGARGGRAGYGLPNDLRVLNAVGSRTGTYNNILEVRYQSTFKPIADAVLTAEDTARLRFEDIRDEIMFVRICDSLGPQYVTGTKRTIADALLENSAVAGQIRSMLLSLWGHRYLIEHGYVDRREATTLYSSFLIPALARARGGLGSTPSQGSTYVLNHLLEAGAISMSAEGRVKIDAAVADGDIVRAAREFISPMARGDAPAIKALLQHYVVVTPAIRDVLERLGPAPEPRRLIYSTADRLDPIRR